MSRSRRLDPGRRRFLRQLARLAAATGVVSAAPGPLALLARSAEPRGADLAGLLGGAPIARWWIGADADGPAPAAACTDCHAPGDLGGLAAHAHADRPVRCLLCAHRCRISAGARGRCRARYNDGGTLHSLVWGRPITAHVDPIEKKPFYHVLPGSLAYSLATSGCPLRCRFCQNWEISQASPEDYATDIVEPRRISAIARSRETPVVAFTYNEPTVFFEYLVDIAEIAREEGLRCVLVSCGFMEPGPLRDLCAVLDAIKIDLKGFRERFYRDVCDAELQPVLRSIEQVAASGTHLEIVNLVVPSLNDADADLRDLAAWVRDHAGCDTPTHFTRFHPDYQLRNLPPTPVATLERAHALALDAGLRFPYVGNVPGHAGDQTYCPGCGAAVIRRRGFFVERLDLTAGRCNHCGYAIKGVWT
ncbi:MAG TPA: AmmeMemoRadiSam system radical SAM enzyme [Candidatus Krumholzibacteria bacterium]|nr:AmmeMemoRadiSam system radical SAM enzyme [Candidatus Krumholzibacteria bacterium]HPD73238.1 AmmeMemoRadiSam system radical SAM enzyme [Candidatus Krumholzibacteria bacterium]HRY40200.1 AmmeMemoRadiSam system radical SAM enzyme [Candidatus Krumholzibacteria bacterium]